MGLGVNLKTQSSLVIEKWNGLKKNVSPTQDILKANGITAKEETLRDPSQALCQIC